MEGNTPQVIADSKPKAEEASSFNLKWLVSTILAIWPWLLGSIIISLIIGNLYLRYATPIFRSTAELLIIDSKKGSGNDDVSKALGLSNSSVNIDNEIEVLKSRTTMTKVVRELHLNINYSIVGRFKITDAYANTPFDFVILDSADDYYGCKVDNLTDGPFRLTEESGKIVEAKWGDTLSLGLGKVKLKKNFDYNPPHLQYTVSINPVISQAKSYMGALEIGSPLKNASYINISMSDNVPQRSVDIIDALMHIYMKSNVDNKNRMLDSTINFIDRRLASVAVELDTVETHIETYKQGNQIADMGAQSSHLINANATTEEKLQTADMDLYLIDALNHYMQNDTGGKAPILQHP